jgi:CheY-like chemotaxis protein
VQKVLKVNSLGGFIKVVVMDFEMPVMSGVEACREIFKLFNEKRIFKAPSIIGYTANVSEETTRIGLEAGMVECLSKSCSKNAFLSLIKKYAS